MHTWKIGCVEAMKRGFSNKIYNVSKFHDDIIEKDRNKLHKLWVFFVFNTGGRYIISL